MNITLEKKDSFSIVTIQSEKLTSEIAPELKAQLIVLSNEGVKNIIVDLSNVRYCDSSGISALLIGDRTCKKNEGKLVLCNLQTTVLKVIEISQLHTVLSIADDLTAAEAMYN